MKKIKHFMMAAVALMVAMSFTACSNDDNNSSNYERYQQEVNAAVNRQKSSNKVILLVAFGSTWQQAYDTFDTILDEYKKEFPGWDVYLSFSSAICINQARAGEHAKDPDTPAEVRNYYDPEHWLTAIGKANYKTIVVQSLQVIPGEEYRRVRDSYVKDFMNNKNNDFTEDYMHSIDKQVAVGVPLMGNDDDVDALANILVNESDIKSMINNGTVVAFMGHGNPEDYDYYGANVRYTELENALQALYPKKFYVGTVDMPGNFVDDVYDRMANRDGITSGSVQFYPLMSIAGDHAHNDMADEDDPESWYSLFKEWGYEASAYETIYPKSAACYTKYVAGTDYIPALGERAAVRALWMQHTQDAIDAIENGDGLSTPTTEVEEE
ncbi:MAG: sirohydrochlorin cobaltochelatase [Bacteroidaceae bacterium]|nr:sirohydrochlorin cobaltochelatase [Bacteroidaceae bacterium]